MTTFTVETIDPQIAAGARFEVPMAELQNVFGRGFAAVAQAAATQGIALTGPPFAFYPRMPTDTVEVIAGFPVAAPIAAEGEVEPFELPGGRVITATHVGPYEAMATTYDELLAWAKSEGLTPADAMWEIYMSDPETEPDPATWRTLIFWPVV